MALFYSSVPVAVCQWVSMNNTRTLKPRQLNRIQPLFLLLWHVKMSSVRPTCHPFLWSKVTSKWFSNSLVIVVDIRNNLKNGLNKKCTFCVWAAKRVASVFDWHRLADWALAGEQRSKVNKRTPEPAFYKPVVEGWGGRTTPAPKPTFAVCKF